MLGAIANPQIADIAGALDIRQKKLDADEAKRKEIRTAQLVKEALPGLREGSPLRELAGTDIQSFALLAKTLGVPLNSGQQMQEQADDAHAISRIAESDPQGAIQYASTLRQKRSDLGLDTSKLDGWLGLAQQDAGKAIRAVQMLDQSLNADLYRKREIEERELSQKDRALSIQERRLSAETGGQNAYFTPVQAADGVYAFNARTGGVSKALDSQGEGVKSAAVDVKLQADLAGAKTGASNEANRQTEARKAVSRSDQLLSNIDEAKKLIPKATGSYLGAARDAAGRAIGVSSDKAKASAKLETLAGWMVSNVPRMEGPQSNIDVENYKNMAARVGDRTLPNEERLAALDILEKLQQKYSSINTNIIQGGSGEGSNTPGIIPDKAARLQELRNKYLSN